jgi:hypothetical protein
MGYLEPPSAEVVQLRRTDRLEPAKMASTSGFDELSRLASRLARKPRHRLKSGNCTDCACHGVSRVSCTIRGAAPRMRSTSFFVNYAA